VKEWDTYSVGPVRKWRTQKSWRLPIHLSGEPVWAGGCRLSPAHAGSPLADFSILKMEAIRSSETSVDGRSTQCHIPEDDILHLCSYLNVKLLRSNFYVDKTKGYAPLRPGQDTLFILVDKGINAFISASPGIHTSLKLHCFYPFPGLTNCIPHTSLSVFYNHSYRNSSNTESLQNHR
jgi:hypothetical protein